MKKARIIKADQSTSNPDEVGTVHLFGPRDSFACGYAYEDYESEETHDSLTCSTCIEVLKWAKSVSRLRG